MKQSEFLKKLANTQFELLLEKETMFAAAWSEISTSDQTAHFDLSESSKEGEGVPKTLSSFLLQSLMFTQRVMLRNLNEFDNNQVRAIKLLCVNLSPAQLTSLVNFVCCPPFGTVNH